MPFGFGRKKDHAAEAIETVAPAASRTGPRTVGFIGYTEDWRLEGAMVLNGRLLDMLNKRDPIELEDVRWAPLDASGPLESAPGIESLDPYDLIVVVAGGDTLPQGSDDERAAHRVHKVSFDVALEAPPFRIVGTIHLHPGSNPESLLERASQMFAAVTDPTIGLGDQTVDLGQAKVVLVNRFYLRDVTQVDRATGQRHEFLPG
ncbi:MAG: hypothetical protein ABI598_04275 [Chloroflexota bacterium]